MYIGYIFFILAIFSGNNIAKLGMLQNFQLGHIEVDGHYFHFLLHADISQNSQLYEGLEAPYSSLFVALKKAVLIKIQETLVTHFKC